MKNEQGSICSLTCHEGFHLFGNGLVECNFYGNWNQTFGYCEGLIYDFNKFKTCNKI